jgi:hypothetical protein
MSLYICPKIECTPPRADLNVNCGVWLVTLVNVGASVVTNVTLDGI